MSTNNAPSDRPPQSGTAVSIIKAIGGVVGFMAVLTIHQWLAPSADPELTVVSSSNVAEPASYHVEEIEAEIQSSDESVESTAESTMQAATGEQPAEASLESAVTEQPAESGLESAVPEQPSVTPSTVELDSEGSMEQSSDAEAGPAGQLPDPDLALTSEVSEHTSVPTADVASIDSSLQDAGPGDNNETPDLQWSAVWRPFFSMTTAKGFADYISESTGLMLRVQPSPVAGHFLVEVQHRTEAERIDADRRIVETTGYRPPGAIK